MIQTLNYLVIQSKSESVYVMQQIFFTLIQSLTEGNKLPIIKGVYKYAAAEMWVQPGQQRVPGIRHLKTGQGRKNFTSMCNFNQKNQAYLYFEAES